MDGFAGGLARRGRRRDANASQGVRNNDQRARKAALRVVLEDFWRASETLDDGTPSPARLFLSRSLPKQSNLPSFYDRGY